MANEPQSKDLGGGYVLTVSVLPGRRGLRVFNRLMKMLGGAGDALKVIGAAALKKGPAADELEAKAGTALIGAIGTINEDDVDFLATELLASATMTTPADEKHPTGQTLPLGNAAHFDAVFAGRVDLVYKSLAHAAMVNYGGFLKGWVQGLLAKVTAAAPAPASK